MCDDALAARHAVRWLLALPLTLAAWAAVLAVALVLCLGRLAWLGWRLLTVRRLTYRPDGALVDYPPETAGGDALPRVRVPAAVPLFERRGGRYVPATGGGTLYERTGAGRRARYQAV